MYHGAEDIFVTTYNETKSFKTKEDTEESSINFMNGSQIFKFVKNFEANGTCEYRRVTSFTPFGLSITQEEYAPVINNFARRI